MERQDLELGTRSTGSAVNAMKNRQSDCLANKKTDKAIDPILIHKVHTKHTIKALLLLAEHLQQNDNLYSTWHRRPASATVS
jgi:hypothetical protein